VVLILSSLNLSIYSLLLAPPRLFFDIFTLNVYLGLKPEKLRQFPPYSVFTVSGIRKARFRKHFENPDIPCCLLREKSPPV